MSTLGRNGGIGATANMVTVVLVGIAVLAIISPATTTLFLQGSAAANASGLEKVVIEHFNVVILLVLTFILFIVLWVGSQT